MDQKKREVGRKSQKSLKALILCPKIVANPTKGPTGLD